MKIKYPDLYQLKFKFTCTLVILLSAFNLQVSGQTNPDHLRLFIIGNSFSQNASTFLPDIARQRGKILTIGRAELGGHSLEQHWSYVEKYEANADDPKGKPYNGKSLKMLLSDGSWDVVTIQQYSYLSGDSSTYYPYAMKLRAYILKLQPNAKIVVHQTWAYRADAKKFGQIGKDEQAKNQLEMWQHSRAAYHKLAAQLKAKLLPVGDAFEEVATNKKYGYKKDVTFDFINPVFPNLPDQRNSINVGYFWKGKEWTFDPNHANDAGKYLGGLIWYSVLFSEPVESVTFKPKDIPDSFAKYLRKVAARVIR